MKHAILALALSTLTAVSAQAGVVSFTDRIDLTVTNWQDHLVLHYFDASLGHLDKVTFRYGGSVLSSFMVENKDAADAVISAESEAKISFSLPGTHPVLRLTVDGLREMNVDAFDGVVDYAGNSGFMWAGQVYSNEATSVFTSNLSSFIGVGALNFAVGARGSSSAGGAGNLQADIATQASANLTVEYQYSNSVVPEPGSLALAGLGLLGVGLLRRKRSI